MPVDSGFDVLLRMLRVLILRKRMIFFITLIPTLLCVILVLFSESTYTAVTLVKPPSKEDMGGISSMLESGLGGGVLGSILGGGESGEDDCISILHSARFGKLVVDRFDLETQYKFKRPGKSRKYYLADVIKTFQSHSSFKVTDENAIQITMDDKSPEQAREMVIFMIEALDSLYIDVQKRSTQQRLEYVDQRLDLAEAEMKKAEDSMVAFQSSNNLIVPSVQGKIILENMAQTEAQMETLKEEMDLEAALRGRSSAKYRDLQIEKDLLQKTARAQFRNQTDSNTLLLPAHALPALTMNYLRLERAYTVKLGVYKYLVQQVEALKLDANKNIQVISVLDPPWTNDKRTAPKRRILVETIFILSFIMAMILAILQVRWRKHQDENPETRQLVMEIKKNLFKP